MAGTPDAFAGRCQEVVKEQFQRLIDGTREQRSGSVTWRTGNVFVLLYPF